MAQTLTIEPAAATGDALKMRVEGMDCGACAIKVENALKRLPGVSDINMNYATETLSVRLDENRTSREIMESKIRSLGYTPIALDGAVSSDTAEPRVAGDQPWWNTRQGRMVLGFGIVLALALRFLPRGPNSRFGHMARRRWPDSCLSPGARSPEPCPARRLVSRP